MNEKKEEQTQATEKVEETRQTEETTEDRSERLSQIASLLSDSSTETEEVKTEVVEEKKEEPAVEKEVKTEEVKTEKVETKEEKTEVKAEETEKPAEETETTETKIVDESEDPDDLVTMRQEMNEMAKKIQGIEPEEKTVETTEAKKVEEKPAEPAAIKEEIKTQPAELTVTKDEFDKAMESEAGFQEVLQNKVNQVASGIVEGRVTEILRSIPKVINDAVDERVTIQLAASDFYRDNPDLTSFKPVVSLVATEVFGKNPGIDYEEGFQKVGEEVRKKLKMGKSAPVSTEKTDEVGPAFVQSKQSRGIQQPDVTGMKADIAETLEIKN